MHRDGVLEFYFHLVNDDGNFDVFGQKKTLLGDDALKCQAYRAPCAL